MFPSVFPMYPNGASRRHSWSLACARLVVLITVMVVPASEVRAQAPSGNFVFNSVQLTNFQVVDNVLTAGGTVTGTLAGLPFTAAITRFALELVPDDPATPAVECSVLNLELAPIHLNLLGLRVDTSAICLDVTATEGGGLLGDLLCALAGGGLLGSGVPVLPNAGEIVTLQDGVLDLLQDSLNLEEADAAAAQQSVCTGQCEILELVLGPIDLSLLGLNVSLDNCEDGPVQVCVSASRNEGILGQLLCGLSNAELINLTLSDIAVLARRALAFLTDKKISGAEIADLSRLLVTLVRS